MNSDNNIVSKPSAVIKLIFYANKKPMIWLLLLILGGMLLFPRPATFIFPFWAGLNLLLALSMAVGLLKHHTYKKTNEARSRAKFLFWLLLFLQVLIGVATFFIWKTVWKNAARPIDYLPLWIWAFSALMGTWILFLLNEKRKQVTLLSKREFLFILASPLWAILAGLSIGELIGFYFRSQQLPSLGFWGIQALNFGLPLLAFNSVLTLAMLPLPAINIPAVLQKKMSPLVIGFLIASALTAAALFIFTIGYSVNDDIYVISLAVGFPSGERTPYLIFVSTLVGLVFRELYALPTNINWYTIVLIGMNIFSVWGMVYMILSRPIKVTLKAMGILAGLVCNFYFLLNLTFTTLTAFATMIGLALIFAACEKGQPIKRGQIASGIALIILAGLVRMLSVFMIFLFVAPLVLLYIRSFEFKPLVFSGGVLALLLVFLLGFDMLYLQGSPEWRSFYEYNIARSRIFDTPRLTNLKKDIETTSWTKVDWAAFQNSFFPDQETFSLSTLRAIASHISNQQGTLISAVMSMPQNFAKPYYLPYGLVLVSSLAGLLFFNFSVKNNLLGSFFSLVFSFSVATYLFWTQKLPDRLLMPIVTVSILVTWALLLWSKKWNLSATLFPHIGHRSIFFFIFLAFTLTITQSSETSRWHADRQSAYQKISSEVELLQSKGILAPNALIVSPAQGLPLEWSNPLIVDFPRINYMIMGWMTFSPVYEDVLQRAGAASLPEGLYENDNIYLMTNPSRLNIIIKFIKQHKGLNVTATEIMDLSNYTNDQVYAKAHLYKLYVDQH